LSEIKEWPAEALEARREYYREYRRKHRDKLKEYDRTYWTRAAARRKGRVQSFTAGISS
jgi:hypothetical protein